MKSQQFSVEVNQQFKFENLSLADLDFIVIGSGSYHVLHKDRAFTGEIVSADYSKKELIVRINGTRYEIRLSDGYDQLVQKLGLSSASSQVSKDIKAPMPGLVLEINAGEGDAVTKGDPLLILEAMKMENVIKAPAEGVVKKVRIQKGSAVEKNQLLIEIE